MQGEKEKFAERQDVATNSCPSKRRPDHNKQSAQRRNGEGG